LLYLMGRLGTATVLHFRLHSYERWLDYACKKINFAADLTKGCRARYKNYASLPTTHEHWTVNKSPFKHKKSRMHYERLTYKRVVAVECDNAEIAREFSRFVFDTIPHQIFVHLTQTSLYKLDDYFNPPRYDILKKTNSPLLQPPKPEEMGLIDEEPITNTEKKGKRIRTRNGMIRRLQKVKERALRLAKQKAKEEEKTVSKTPEKKSTKAEPGKGDKKGAEPGKGDKKGAESGKGDKKGTKPDEKNAQPEADKKGAKSDEKNAQTAAKNKDAKPDPKDQKKENVKGTKIKPV